MKEMVANKELELLEKSRVSMKITVAEGDVKKTYDDLVKDYCQKVRVDGFRVGKVPPNILISKYGDIIQDETVKAVIEKSLEEVFDTVEYKPLPYAVPELKDKPVFEAGKDFSFEISYDTYPKVKLDNYKGLKIPEVEADIKKEDLDRELDILRDENAIVVEKKDGVVAQKDVITIDYAELDAGGNEVEGSKREGFTFTVGSGYNLYKIDDEMIGMKKEEEKVLHKEYPEDFEYPAMAGKKVDLKVKIVQVKEKQLPALDDELAQDINEKYKTLDDLKKDIEERLKNNAEEKIREYKITKILEQIKDNTEIVLPDSMVNRELEREWLSMVYYSGGREDMVLKELEKQGSSKGKYLEERKADAEESLKMSVIIEELIEAEKIEATNEEIEAEIKAGAEKQNISLEDARERVKANKMEASIRFGLQKKKLFDLLLSSATYTKGKKVKYQDLLAGKFEKEKDK
ncbi:MAG: trigger factor [Spirochaetales bacterium]|nr:trigger factor [Spirochaetales bacterium]